MQVELQNQYAYWTSYAFGPDLLVVKWWKTYINLISQGREGVVICFNHISAKLKSFSNQNHIPSIANGVSLNVGYKTTKKGKEEY